MKLYIYIHILFKIAASTQYKHKILSHTHARHKYYFSSGFWNVCIRRRKKLGAWALSKKICSFKYSGNDESTESQVKGVYSTSANSES